MHVVLGRAWSNKTSAMISDSNMRFKTPDQSNKDAELSVLVYARPNAATAGSTTVDGTQSIFEVKDNRTLV